MNISAKLLAVVACLLWGSAFAGAKIAFEFVPPITLSGMRFMLAGVLLLPLLIYRRENILEGIKENWRFMSLFALVQTFLQYGLFYMGLDKVPGALASIIIGVGPMFIMVMAHFAMPDDKMTLRKVLALVLALSGVLFISLTKGGYSVDSEVFYTGIALLLLSNLVGSYTNIMVAKYQKPLSAILLTGFANFTGGCLLLVMGLFVEPQVEMLSLPAEFYFAIIWLAIIPAAGFSIWYSLLARPTIKVSDLNMWKFIIPVSGCVLSWIFLPGESVNLYSLIGITVIVISLRIYQAKAK